MFSHETTARMALSSAGLQPKPYDQLLEHERLNVVRMGDALLDNNCLRLCRLFPDAAAKLDDLKSVFASLPRPKYYEDVYRGIATHPVFGTAVFGGFTS
jgi:hypothetical protein